MDRLDEVLSACVPLLDRVDDLLETAGAPEGHEVWRELRRVRLLPGDAARAVAGLRPAAFDDAVDELRAEARTCAEAAIDLPAAGDWTGDAADAYETARRRVADRLSGDDESLDERLEATADLAQALTDWMTKSRSDLAGTLAEMLSSGEALTLAAGLGSPPTVAETGAAATVAAQVLRTIADNYADADELLQGSIDLGTPVPM
ncbi:hypothetical protein GCM10010172_00700 [Paractinoplanes ferrugineus]|uniref:Uncharacterized protein n=1 Tax=Paractinoplanes ferrugineus TaxID=113564 RepID=A0A919J5X4_9ACTN|nr:hypothetical protein [Actinoplanes ferrugineus]GIE13917.1 hypothetical protein Afe05nite_57570 [Actinoplanes ferrugineus]